MPSLARLFPTLVLLYLSSPTAAQPACPSGTPANYPGPCYHGLLPAFFDDFAYTSSELPATAPGSIFGANAWTLRDDTVHARGWFRYNRNDLPMAGALTFQTPSVLTMTLPERLSANGFQRGPVLFTGASMTSGTYHWRVRLSALWPGQWVRHAAWVMSPSTYLFDRFVGSDSTRLRYWSELDFENENHYQGEWRGGTFHPDYVTRMTATNHVGHVIDTRGEVGRLSHSGPTAWTDGADVLARDGPAREPDGAPVTTWADRWLHLMLTVDEAARTVTYRMLPAERQPNDPLQPVAERTVTIGEAFYPEAPLMGALSLHWLHPDGALHGTLWMEADWFYYSPAVGLTDADVRRQVEGLRAADLVRVNTTGRPTFEPRDQPERLRAILDGPERAACGEPTSWTVRAWPGGSRYLTRFRYRLALGSGAFGPWLPVYAPRLTLTPQSGQTGVELMATLQDLWEPHPPSILATTWPRPHPDNYAHAVYRAVPFACDP